ncbi:hypothetical protein AGABI2DRAFT_122877 [Agaricus bisporus var. bisporus H97]|uniref:hypothetical protein n=1 Tax=Agaricus bisporus var. bisporus (strain H97 / ATCC MYA-4626 / FGSC 10389) TaxID=936046 RepID=UPI00029F5F55|nr:hypothetical protein AGABI2DRAFT_122877 [Agaricus bisporus var. bisporus H97]EKV42146.1 hypothetical protein AGABI2DRAFT_122877 [Agaricus bisporus var. bisporus H97]
MASSPTPTATYRPAHVLSEKSSRQHRNVFIWCTVRDKVALGWRVGDDSPVTISTAYRWITTAVEVQSPGWKEVNTFILCPVHIRPSGVLTYRVRQNGAALPRGSHDTIAPGDYGVYTIGDDSDPRLYFRFEPEFSFASMEIAVEMNSPSLLSKASLTPTLIQQAMDRDHECLFSGGRGSDELVASWIFPPFLGYKASLPHLIPSY